MRKSILNVDGIIIRIEKVSIKHRRRSGAILFAPDDGDDVTNYFVFLAVVKYVNLSPICDQEILYFKLLHNE